MFIEIPVNSLSLGMRKPVFGVGVNDADYIVSKLDDGVTSVCPYYSRWTNMLLRCYSKSKTKKTASYLGCSVSEDWLLFSSFKGWMEKQDWSGQHLDKDLLVPGNKVYSAESCIFVSPQVNTILVKIKRTSPKLKVGVSFHKIGGRYESYCNNSGKRVYLGMFDSEQEAHDSYCDYKYKLIADIAAQQTEPLKSALLNYKISEY